MKIHHFERTAWEDLEEACELYESDELVEVSVGFLSMVRSRIRSLENLCHQMEQEGCEFLSQISDLEDELAENRSRQGELDLENEELEDRLLDQEHA